MIVATVPLIAFLHLGAIERARLSRRAPSSCRVAPSRVRFHVEERAVCGTLIPKSRQEHLDETIVILYVPRRIAAYAVDATCGRWYGNLLRTSFRRARVKSAASSKPGVTTADESGTLWGYGYRKTTRSRIAIESHSGSFGSVSTATASC